MNCGNLVLPLNEVTTYPHNKLKEKSKLSAEVSCLILVRYSGTPIRWANHLDVTYDVENGENPEKNFFFYII